MHRKFTRLVVMETPGDGGSGAPATTESAPNRVEVPAEVAQAAPAPPTATPPAEQPSAPAQPGPWAADLEQRFTDPAIRGQVDSYLREVVQPRTTQLEQELSQIKEQIGDGEPIQLFNDLLTNPRETLAAVAMELFGDEQDEANYDPDLVGQLTALFTGQQGEAQPQAEAAQAEPAQQQDYSNLPPEVRELIEERQAEQARAEYDRVVDEFLTQHQELGIEQKDALHPWIVAAEGDLDQAAQGYLAYQQEQEQALRQRLGIPDDWTPAVAPVAGGQSAAAPATPNTVPQRGWDQFGDAVDDFLSEQRRGPAPPVGNV